MRRRNRKLEGFCTNRCQHPWSERLAACRLAYRWNTPANRRCRDAALRGFSRCRTGCMVSHGRRRRAVRGFGENGEPIGEPVSIYQEPWFWGVAAAGVLAVGGVAYYATR